MIQVVPCTSWRIKSVHIGRSLDPRDKAGEDCLIHKDVRKPEVRTMRYTDHQDKRNEVTSCHIYLADFSVITRRKLLLDQDSVNKSAGSSCRKISCSVSIGISVISFRCPRRPAIYLPCLLGLAALRFSCVSLNSGSSSTESAAVSWTFRRFRDILLCFPLSVMFASGSKSLVIKIPASLSLSSASPTDPDPGETWFPLLRVLAGLRGTEAMSWCVSDGFGLWRWRSRVSRVVTVRISTKHGRHNRHQIGVPSALIFYLLM